MALFWGEERLRTLVQEENMAQSTGGTILIWERENRWHGSGKGGVRSLHPAGRKTPKTHRR